MIFQSLNRKGGRRTKRILMLTFLTMLLEMAAGILFGSMGLLADVWFMGTTCCRVHDHPGCLY